MKTSEQANKDLDKAMDKMTALGERVACSEEQYADLFFPEVWHGDHQIRSVQFRMQVMEQEAKILCELCPIKMECASVGIIDKHEFGIWGGTTPAERKAIWNGLRTKPE